MWEKKREANMTKYDNANGTIDPASIDGYQNAKQVPAGKTTADHPGHNRPTHDKNGKPIQYSDGKNPPASHQKDTRKKQSNTAVQEVQTASYAAGNGGFIKLNWWQRNMPRWLLGATDEDKKRYQKEQEITARNKEYTPLLAQHINKNEVMTGVSVADLKEAGFSDAKIQNMIQVIERKKATEALKMGGMGSLAAHLAEHGETLKVDAKELGITNEQVQLIQSIASKNAGKQ